MIVVGKALRRAIQGHVTANSLALSFSFDPGLTVARNTVVF